MVAEKNKENKEMNAVQAHKDFMRMTTTPLAYKRTVRPHVIDTMTSIPSGKFVPVAFIPVLRGDSLKAATINFASELQETTEILMNGVDLTIRATLVPHLVNFDSMDELNRAYMGEGGTYFATHTPANPENIDIYKYAGLHALGGDEINQEYIRAYNQAWNYYAKNRSPNITPKSVTQTQLNEAFWPNNRFSHIVPDVDLATMDGEVPLNVVASEIPIRGMMQATAVGPNGTYKRTDDNSASYSNPDVRALYRNGEDAGTVTIDGDVQTVWGELQENGITVSLSNLEMAKKAQAFARMRERYAGHDDNYIIDLLMQGLQVPDQSLKQPIPLGAKTQTFGLSKRYSTGTDLTDSVVNGVAALEMNIATPVIPCGGVVVFTAELTPTQLFERQADPFLQTTDPETLPNAKRDELDPEKVEIVQNKYIDVLHSTGTDTFGYAHTNHKWGIRATRMGGKFYRPITDGTNDTNRQRLWAVEAADPDLTEDFYIVSELENTPFLDLNADPAELVAQGVCSIEGLTVFGPPLIEGSDNYAEVLEDVDQNRIVKEA